MEIKSESIRSVESQLKRNFAIKEIYSTFLNEIIIGKKKQIRFRQWLYNRLKYGSEKAFETEDEEYQFINKFGRGMWEETQLRKTFNKREMLIIVQLAHDYGAFDY